MDHRETTTEMARPLSGADRERFHTLLKLAAESPFPGERANALDAARRLAGRHGMTLEEAARPPGEWPVPKRPAPPMPRHPMWGRYTPPRPEAPGFVYHGEARLRAEKARYEDALRDAIARGLDADLDEGVRERFFRPRANGRKRSPSSFARVLLAETSLPLSEIVSLTGLDIYEIVGMKLRMRTTA